MANLLHNAAFLDETTAWAATAGATLSVDEQTWGAPGRAALLAASALAAGQTVKVEPASAKRAAVAPGSRVEAAVWLAARVGGQTGDPRAALVFRGSSGGVIESHDLTVSPAALSARGEGLKGDRATYRRAWGRFVAPAGTATATIEATLTAVAGGTAQLALLKPLLAVVPVGRDAPLAFDPGPSDNADLQLPCWPADLRPFQSGPGSEPRPAVAEFEAGSQRPSQRRTSPDPARRFNGRLRCDGVEREALEQFWRATGGDFWFVEPDSDRLCVASFAADGAPRMTEERGPTCIMQVGLWLETA